MTVASICDASDDQMRQNEIAALHAYADQDRGVALVYFIGGADGPVKIGFSVDVPHRLRTLRDHSPVPLGLLAVAKGGRRREEAYHVQFAVHRLHGEWFSRCPEIEAEIAHLNGRKA